MPGFCHSAVKRKPTAVTPGPSTSLRAARISRDLTNDPDLLARRVGRENTMAETRARALGGSPTADNLADIADTTAFDASTIANIATGRWGTAAGQIGGALGDVFTGMTPQTRSLIVKALMSSDPNILRGALRQQNISDGQRAIIEALMRIPIMQSGGANEATVGGR